jgi:hypothetical protein
MLIRKHYYQVITQENELAKGKKYNHLVNEGID